MNEWYSIPEFSENAADTIIEAFAHYYEWDEEYRKELPVVGSVELPARTEPLSEETKAIIAEYLTDNQKAIDLLVKGAAIEHSRYPVDFTKGLNALTPYLRDVSMGVKMLRLAAILHAENREPQLAVDSIIAMFGIARSLDKAPILISQMVRMVSHDRAVSVLERVVNRTELTDKQLMDIGQILFKAEDHYGMARAFIGERCITGSYFKDPPAQGISMYAQPLIGLYKVVGLADVNALLYIDYMTKYIEALQLEPHQRREALKAIEADFDKISKNHILLHMIRPEFSGRVDRDLYCIAKAQAARVGVAVQRYRLAVGDLPDTAGDLVPTYLDAIPKDPFDGKDLRYKKLDTGFVVYSIGKDGNDDGGTEKPPRGQKRSNSPTYDITFIVQR